MHHCRVAKDFVKKAEGAMKTQKEKGYSPIKVRARVSAPNKAAVVWKLSPTGWGTADSDGESDEWLDLSEKRKSIA